MNNEPNYTVRWLAIGLVLFGIFKGTGGHLPFPLPGPAPAPAPDVPAPPADLQSAVSQVASLAKGFPADAAAAAPLYLAQAKLIEADSAAATGRELLKTTDGLRQLNTRSGGLLFSAQGWKGKHPEMNPAIEAAFTQAMGGTDNKTLDAALRQRAAATWRAVAWALSGGK
ncbi:MAG: hypothetical protein U0836_16210 [Pirellulales bacterium]